MSKNTGTSELVNYFDLGVDRNLGIRGNLTLSTIANATVNILKSILQRNNIS